MNKRITALFMGLCLSLSCTSEIKAVPEEQRASLDPSATEIIDVSEKPEEPSEESMPKVTLYQDIEVSSADDLIRLARDCRLDTWSVDKRVVLTQDINVYDTEFTSIRTFGGYFDGQGHTIRGINGGDKKSFVGLFNTLRPTAVIADLNVEGVLKPEGASMVVGGITGDNYGTIENCSFAGTIKGKDYVGGIAGFNEAGGSIVGCRSYGKVTGVHYTGGICGENAGGIANCVNSCSVNTNVDDSRPTLTDLNPDSYRESLLYTLKGDEREKRSSDPFIKGTTDTGGIAGLSLGAVTGCTNEGTVGYEHVGYNTGGIAGRSSGYIEKCTNEGLIYGRKDVGGIVGQAEPYVQLDLTEDIIAQVSENINVLHDLIDTTLKDAGNSSDTITMRLNVVKSFADKALDDTNYLANNTVDFVNNAMSFANEAVDRIDFVLKELDKNGGVFDILSDAGSETQSSVKQLAKAVKDIKIEKYMSDADRELYKYAREQLELAPEDYEDAKEIAEKPYNIMFLDKELNESDSDFRKELENSDPVIEYPAESLDNVFPYDAEGNKLPWPQTRSVEDYQSIAGVGHFDGDTLVSNFPTDADKSTPWYPYLRDAIKKDKRVYNAAHQSGDGLKGEITEKIDEEYMSSHGGNERKDHGDGDDYSSQMVYYSETIADLLQKYNDDLTEQEREDLGSFAGYAGNAMSSLDAAGKGVREIISDLNGKSDLSLPYLSNDFHVRTNSLNSNMQGISDNLGFLNQEMGGSADTLIEDLSDVNNQFNKLMLIITDAIDGALDTDYTTVFEDNSDDVALTSVDGTVADSVNNARIEGDTDVSGIAGAMGIEYEFDLESDVTGISDTKLNPTYLTKCILRSNINRGYIRSEKSYCGGVTGMQEMGTVILCENYGKISSASGDYVGGIAGQSLSTIKNCSASSIESGRTYVGGIAGKGYEVYDCYAIPNIEEADDFIGAIAGDREDNSVFKNNYFYSYMGEFSGIDGASYAGKAEPLGYETLLQMEGVPEAFKTFTVSFTMDDQEIELVSLKYGEDILKEDFPVPELPEGYYLKWDQDGVWGISSNMEVRAEQCRLLTTIASERLRDNGQSVILADGSFKDGDVLSVESLVSLGLPVKNVTEHFLIKLPKDGELNHRLRFQPLKEQTVEIYVKVGNEWRKLDTEKYGDYELFDTSGNTVELIIASEQGRSRLLIIAAAAGGVVLLLILFVIIRKLTKRKKGGRHRLPEPT
ncbi:MAG TPA: hypothetical protein DCL38_05965 [Lachnospiraceae bacterium]|nr:hypothetical protein [Lachnospiraceae bacterium]